MKRNPNLLCLAFCLLTSPVSGVAAPPPQAGPVAAPPPEAGPVAAPPPQAAPATAQTEPLVVFIHGRDQSTEDPTQLRAAWFAAFQRGEATLGLADPIPKRDLAFVWYGDIYGTNPPPPPDRCKFATGAVTNERLRRALAGLANKAGLGRIISRSFIHDTYLYLSDLSFRCSTDERLAAALRTGAAGGRPVILVAHSMGAIVSLSTLWNSRDAPTDIVQLVTFGAQVGVPEVLEAIQGSMVQPPLPVPIDVRAWTNLKNRGDALAFTAARRFKATDKAREPQEIDIDTPDPSRHSALGYLSDAHTSRSIVAAWCRAFAPPSSGPPLCTGMR